MKTNNSWPDAATYKPLTIFMVHAAAPHTTAGLATARIEEYFDDDTDEYISSNLMPQSPFTIPHLYMPVELMGPLISDSPLSVKALLDIGCPLQ
jgi:hypothetical protein